MKKETKYIKGTEDDYTHIKFYYDKGTMITNKSTYLNYYHDEIKHAVKFEYLIEVE